MVPIPQTAPRAGVVATGPLQELVDELRPAVDLYPLCENRILPILLKLRMRRHVEIGLPELRAHFDHCQNLRPLFFKIRTPS